MRQSPQRHHEHGHVIYILAVFLELLLIVSLSGALALQRTLWARSQAYTALVFALHAAGSQLQLPVGPAGPQIDSNRAAQVFSSVLLADLPPALVPLGTPLLSLYSAGSTDPVTGYRFSWPGVGGGLQFSTVFLGLTFSQVVHADVEVPHGSD
ncbi:MAG: hypothetical protein ACYCO4_07685 [Sulfobacillus sp.]